MKTEKHTIKITIEFDIFEQLTHTAWRRVILIIAKDKCEICGDPDNLHCHHIDQNSSNNCIANGMCLCGSCHAKLHTDLRNS